MRREAFFLCRDRACRDPGAPCHIRRYNRIVPGPPYFFVCSHDEIRGHNDSAKREACIVKSRHGVPEQQTVSG